VLNAKFSCWNGGAGVSGIDSDFVFKATGDCSSEKRRCGITSTSQLDTKSRLEKNMKSWISILFGLFVIWTGLLRGIEAQAYKPNSLWFCLLIGMLCIFAGFLFRMEKSRIALSVGTFAALVVLSFYFYCFVSQPEKDASYRVGLIIVASIGYLSAIYFPPGPLQRFSAKHE
jgi:peptidoglycan/LPS O-acetylase OafA/YrhL